MDTRLTADQAELFDTVRRLTADLAATTVVDLDDEVRRGRLVDALTATGVRELRDRHDGVPLASGVEAALVAEALGGAVADVAYLGPLLAGDLRARAGLASDGARATVALDADLAGLAVAVDGRLAADAVAIDAAGATHALVTRLDEHGAVGLAHVALPADAADISTDITRRVVRLEAGRAAAPVGGELTAESLQAWRALGLAVAAADAVGAMRGAVRLGVDYAAERRQYGAPVGSFQAVQHLLADAHSLVEGALSISRHAAWAVDELSPTEALRAASSAAAYAGRAQRTVAETVVQVHGGIGNTWECMAHVFLRRTMHDDALLGSAEALLTELADPAGWTLARTGGTDGLS